MLAGSGPRFVTVISDVKNELAFPGTVSTIGTKSTVLTVPVETQFP